MKKNIASPRWLAIGLVILIFLILADIASIILVVYGTRENRCILQGIALFVLGWMLLATGVVLFLLNRKACWVWLEGGCLKRRGLLFGFRKSISAEEVHAVGLTYGDKEIFVISLGEHPHTAREITLQNNEANMRMIRSFWDGPFYGG